MLLERNRDGMGPVTFTPDSEMMLEPNDRLIILLLRDSITAVGEVEVMICDSLQLYPKGWTLTVVSVPMFVIGLSSFTAR